MRYQDIPIALDKDEASLAADWLTGVQKSMMDRLYCLLLKETLLLEGGRQGSLLDKM